MRRSISISATAVCALMLLLTGCGTDALEANPNDRLLAMWAVDAAPVGSLAEADSALVSYVREGDGLALTAWDAASGEVLWSSPAAVGAVAPGIEITSTAIDTAAGGFTAYLAPMANSEWQRVVVADIRTGDAVDVETPPVWALSRPSLCEDGSSFCLRGYLDGTDAAQDIRIDPAEARYRARPAASGDRARPLGLFVHSTGERAPDGVEMLQYVENDGAVRWARTYEDVFGVGASSDGGWYWLDESARGVLVGVGSVVQPEARAVIREGGVGSIDLPTAFSTVGLDPGTGSTAWAIAGARFCPHMQVGSLRADARIIPLCAYIAGTETAWLDDSTQITSARDGVAVDMIGVEAETGDVVWRLSLDPQAFTDPQAGGFIATPEALVAPTPGGASIVAIETGERTTTRVEAVLACAAPRPPLDLIWINDGAREPWPFNAGEGLSSCDRHGRAAHGFSGLAARSGGLELDNGSWAMSVDDGIVVVSPSR